jgi:hypothetical protein
MEPDEKGERASSLIRGLSIMGKDIEDNNLQGRAVINLSAGIGLPPWEESNGK